METFQRMTPLIAMAVYCTAENNKDEYLLKTLNSLSLTKHDFDLVLSVNSYTPKTKDIIETNLYGAITKVIWNSHNIGTAEAINKVWKEREHGQHCIKMDDDVVINDPDWLGQLLECLNRDSQIGIIGLKRKDCIENVDHEDPYYRSELIQLSHIPGHRWYIVEKAAHVMGTCQLYNSALLDKIGYLYQPNVYGWDDVLACARSRAAGFYNCFLPHIDIDHIDPGTTPFQKWKEQVAFKDVNNINQMINDYLSHKKPYYYNPFK